MKRIHSALVDSIINTSSIYDNVLTAVENINSDEQIYAVEISPCETYIDTKTAKKYKLTKNKKYYNAELGEVYIVPSFKITTFSVTPEVVELENDEHITYFIGHVDSFNIPLYIPTKVKKQDVANLKYNLLDKLYHLLSYVKFPEAYSVFKASDTGYNINEKIYLINTKYTKDSLKDEPCDIVKFKILDEHKSKVSIDNDHYFITDLFLYKENRILLELFDKKQIEEAALVYDTANHRATMYELLERRGLIRDDSDLLDIIRGEENVDVKSLSQTTALKILSEYFLGEDYHNFEPVSNGEANIYLVADILKKYPTKLKKFIKDKTGNNAEQNKDSQ